MEKTVFCANCQVETVHTVAVVRNSHGYDEVIFTCPCGRQFKLSADLSKEELAAAITAHKAHNLGQVPAESVQIPADHPVLKHLAEL